MTAADKLRELLATRPAMPDTVELVRWWRTSGELVSQVLDGEAKELRLGIEGILAAGRAGTLFADLRHLLDSTDAREWTSLKAIVDVLAAADRRHAEDRAQVDVLKQEVRELEQQRDGACAKLEHIKPPADLFEEGNWRSCTGCHSLNEGHATGPYCEIFRCNLGGGCHECGGLGAVWEYHGALKCCPRFSWGDGTHDLDCRDRQKPCKTCHLDADRRCRECGNVYDDGERERMEAGHG